VLSFLKFGYSNVEWCMLVCVFFFGLLEKFGKVSSVMWWFVLLLESYVLIVFWWIILVFISLW